MNLMNFNEWNEVIIILFGIICFCVGLLVSHIEGTHRLNDAYDKYDEAVRFIKKQDEQLKHYRSMFSKEVRNKHED